MYPKLRSLNWLKSRTFWQVALSLIFLTVLQALTKGVSVNNSLSNTYMESQPKVTPAEQK